MAEIFSAFLKGTSEVLLITFTLRSSILIAFRMLSKVTCVKHTFMKEEYLLLKVVQKYDRRVLSKC